MQTFFIRLVNAEFESRDDGADYDDAAAAMKTGIRSATAIVVDEIEAGGIVSAVQVVIENASGTTLRRSVVALSVSPLLVDEVPPPA